MTVAVRFERVSRHFGDVRAVDDVSFEVQDGEFFAMLGPSGSGKTTSLRLIAGFDQPTSGHIEIHGSTAEGVPPYDRDVNTVFQDYALFPHMNVIDNVSYSLMVRGVDKAERHRRAEDMLALVKLGGYGSRKPAALSGGQRQRVALARALINRPKVLLLDEPLGALDLKLREEMQVELKALQRQVGITFVFVTHDQAEALSMSDRLAVFNEGRIEQIGTPEDIYARPSTPFVAQFVGTSNVLDAESARRLAGLDGPGSIRPERMGLILPGETPPAGAINVSGTIEDHQYHGASSRYQVRLEDRTSMVVVVGNTAAGEAVQADVGQAVTVFWRKEDMHRLSNDGAAE
ncbi:MAG: ABC transporter ATP-binding protein [Alphaproteobacteria bacterium]|nr:ABC transporter ATP-binding protein [Alphaproteobacteria bacterium]